MAKWTSRPEIAFFSFILIIFFFKSTTNAVTYRLENINEGYLVETFNLHDKKRVRRDASITSTPDNSSTSTTPFPSTTPKLFEENTKIYYKYNLDERKENFKKYWIDLDDRNDGLEIRKHDSLSNAHRLGASIRLNNHFIFYGHYVSTVTITTGGFLYLSDFIHQHITQTQYMAPLMANFDTTLGKDSTVHYGYNKTVFVAEWRNVYLQDHQKEGPFHFQIVWLSNGTIYFNYKTLPMSIKDISDEKHPVKIGLADAFYIDEILGRLIRRRIYQYHSVDLNNFDIRSETTVILHMVPTCVQIRDCAECVTKKIGFDCNWCPEAGYCSDGMDRFRQTYLTNGCHKRPINATTCKENNWTPRPTPKPNGLSKKRSSSSNKSGAVVAIVIVVLLLITLIAGVVGWVVYAYRNPSSSSGRWLIEHRPQNFKASISKLNIFNYMKQRSNAGDKYQVRIGSAGSQSNA